jgi:hypothetical protein
MSAHNDQPSQSLGHGYNYVVEGGYSKVPISEVSPRKGGHNPIKSQVEVRPGRPAPMRPAGIQGRSNAPEKGE